MNAHNDAKSVTSWKHIAERSVYALLATALIGHVMFVDSPLSAVSITMVLIGAVFGIIAAWGLTPVNHLFKRYAPEEVVSSVLPFVAKKRVNTRETDSGNKRAA